VTPRVIRCWQAAFCLLLPLMICHPAFGYDCPKPAQQVTQDVSSEIKSNVSLLQGLGGANFESKAQTVTQDVFSKYPHADNVIIAITMISMFCQVILPSAMPDAEKLDRLYRLEDMITRTNGQSVPMQQSVGKTCSTAPQDVLRPITALFEAWQKLDVDEYLAQWGPEAIARSKFYVMREADIVSRRRADFAGFKSVSVLAIAPKIDFADGTKARISNVYTMHFVARDGKVIDEKGVGESYVLECAAATGQWRIRENNDYLFRNDR
jgi:hypothetical protein